MGSVESICDPLRPGIPPQDPPQRKGATSQKAPVTQSWDDPAPLPPTPRPSAFKAGRGEVPTRASSSASQKSVHIMPSIGVEDAAPSRSPRVEPEESWLCGCTPGFESIAVPQSPWAGSMQQPSSAGSVKHTAYSVSSRVSQEPSRAAVSSAASSRVGELRASNLDDYDWTSSVALPPDDDISEDLFVQDDQLYAVEHVHVPVHGISPHLTPDVERQQTFALRPKWQKHNEEFSGQYAINGYQNLLKNAKRDPVYYAKLSRTAYLNKRTLINRGHDYFDEKSGGTCVVKSNSNFPMTRNRSGTLCASIMSFEMGGFDLELKDSVRRKRVGADMPGHSNILKQKAEESDKWHDYVEEHARPISRVNDHLERNKYQLFPDGQKSSFGDFFLIKDGRDGKEAEDWKRYTFGIQSNGNMYLFRRDDGLIVMGNVRDCRKVEPVHYDLGLYGVVLHFKTEKDKPIRVFRGSFDEKGIRELVIEFMQREAGLIPSGPPPKATIKRKKKKGDKIFDENKGEDPIERAKKLLVRESVADEVNWNDLLMK
mmetsp:Transcript_8173/g.12954  ORF Transcript_8173/g.12954 Transcript_8173/m.12954 type:complete len:541 (+) Transcript_8173:2-1624(+)